MNDDNKRAAEIRFGWIVFAHLPAHIRSYLSTAKRLRAARAMCAALRAEIGEHVYEELLEGVLKATPDDPDTKRPPPPSPSPGMRGIMYLGEDQIEFKSIIVDGDNHWPQVLTPGRHIGAVHVGTVHHGPHYSFQIMHRVRHSEPEWDVVVVDRPGSTDDA